MTNQLKALEILNKLSSSLKDNEGIINWDCSIDFLHRVNNAIEELENYESDMDKYLDYTTNSRCSKSFNSNLNQIKQAHDKAIEDIEYSQIRKAVGL